ncbi:Protein of unknown function [Pyronema omphalodes CBS 100304]|uniref:Uncharacterized protein n=1 Tax=Pyronema omphalodes (strain CBS 100304) TaxID=1076935 RepID=U4LBW1_PYROM|nr:Protein of unknown function [Pyronema omphalodes CBS 100304]
MIQIILIVKGNMVLGLGLIAHMTFGMDAMPAGPTVPA